MTLAPDYAENFEIRAALNRRKRKSKLVVEWECLDSLIDAALDYWMDETDSYLDRRQ